MLPTFAPDGPKNPKTKNKLTTMHYNQWVSKPRDGQTRQIPYPTLPYPTQQSIHQLNWIELNWLNRVADGNNDFATECANDEGGNDE